MGVFPSFVAYVVGCRGLCQAVERHSPNERQDNYTSFGLQYQLPDLSGHDTIRVGPKAKTLELFLVSLYQINHLRMETMSDSNLNQFTTASEACPAKRLALGHYPSVYANFID